MVNAAKTCAWKNVPKIDNEGSHGTAAINDVRGDVVREMIEDDLMGNEFSNKWWGHVVPWCSKSLLISYAYIFGVAVLLLAPHVRPRDERAVLVVE